VSTLAPPPTAVSDDEGSVEFGDDDVVNMLP
jgi:hypothetical protein